jgi:hypothetical protein
VYPRGGCLLQGTPHAACKCQRQHRSSDADKGADKVAALSIAAGRLDFFAAVSVAPQVP